MDILCVIIGTEIETVAIEIETEIEIETVAIEIETEIEIETAAIETETEEEDVATDVIMIGIGV